MMSAPQDIFGEKKPILSARPIAVIKGGARNPAGSAAQRLSAQPHVATITASSMPIER
jgi:hypothetical protein